MTADLRLVDRVGGDRTVSRTGDTVHVATHNVAGVRRHPSRLAVELAEAAAAAPTLPAATAGVPGGRDAEVDGLQRRMDAWESTAAGVLRQHFAREERVVVEKLSGAKTKRVFEAKAAAPPRDPQQPQGAPSPQAQVTGAVLAAQVYDVAKWAQALADDADGWISGVYGDFFADWYAAHVGRVVGAGFTVPDSPLVTAGIATQVNRIKGVAQTTFDQIAGALADGVDAGDGVPQLTARVRAVFAGASAARAEMIARTEVAAAANGARHYAAREAGVAAHKVWVSTPDYRTRPTHRKLNGQRRPIDAYFHVAGHRLAFPGDPSAPPSETVSCRCVLVYDVGITP